MRFFEAHSIGVFFRGRSVLDTITVDEVGEFELGVKSELSEYMYVIDKEFMYKDDQREEAKRYIERCVQKSNENDIKALVNTIVCKEGWLVKIYVCPEDKLKAKLLFA